MNCSKIEKLKTYWAIENKPLQPKAKLIHFIKRNEKQHLKAHIKEVPDSKIASLEYTVFKELTNYYALKSICIRVDITKLEHNLPISPL
jgi:23S rRNA pseudouridine1911/1915/1917 synthase